MRDTAPDPAAMPAGIAKAVGDVFRSGEMGCARRTGYTAIGRTANLGARICGVAEADQVLICGTTWDMVRGHGVEAEPRPPVQLKGISAPVAVFSVTRVPELA
ncbi:MAG: adenylate/guanylate cyclase domain-containing protein [Planctomycetota bacterium]